MNRARDWPNENACMPAPFTCRVSIQIKIPMKMIGRRNGASVSSQYPKPLGFSTEIVTAPSSSGVTPYVARVSGSDVPLSFFVSCTVPSTSVTSTVSPRTMMLETVPVATAAARSEMATSATSSLMSERNE